MKTAPTKSMPRFFPTLTEVVQLPEHSVGLPVSVAPTPAVPAISLADAALRTHPTAIEDEIAAQVLRDLAIVLPARVQAAAESVIQAHWTALAPTMNRALELVVRECVQEALSRQQSALKP